MSDARIRTYTGKMFDVLEPNPADVDLIDIAHALSCQGRFTGHTKEFYSVAQHSVYVSHLVPPKMGLSGLLHDATEAYLVDLPSPIKRSTPAGVIFKQMENKLWLAIATHFQLPDILPPEIKHADSIMLLTEKRDLMSADGDSVSNYKRTWVKDETAEPAEFIIKPLLPADAEGAFLQRFNVLQKER